MLVHTVCAKLLNGDNDDNGVGDDSDDCDCGGLSDCCRYDCLGVCLVQFRFSLLS
jgi:hypothetical protein